MASALQTETAFPGEMRSGTKGVAQRRVQEWLTLHGHGLVLDGQFGPATAEAVRAFQRNVGIPVTGVVDSKTWSGLVGPMLRATAKATIAGSGDAVRSIALAHLDEHPREVGGQNRGPWVRLYCDGKEGNDYPWCAGFATYVVRQAKVIGPAATRTLSCDVLAAAHQKAGTLIAQATPASVMASVTPGSVFFVVNANNKADRNHVGIVTKVAPDGSWIHTVEGNTNDEGSREGYEVCSRTRAVGKLDFGIIL